MKGPKNPRNRIDVLVLTYWNSSDALIQTYTLPYVKFILDEIPAAGKVFLVTMERSPGPPAQFGERIVHIPIRYRRFGIRAFFSTGLAMLRLLALILGGRIGKIHAWCTPAGSLGWILTAVTGVPLVVDSYEPHAEAMVENGTWLRGSVAFKLLFWLEKKQTHGAQHLIAVSRGMNAYAREKFGYTGGMFVKAAGVDLEKFSPASARDPVLLHELGLQDKFIMVYAGKFGGIYLDQAVFDLFRCARDHWGPSFHVLLLTAHTLNDLRPYMDRAGVHPSMFTIRSVPHASMPRYLGLADMGITPVKPVPTKQFCSPIKDGEYWAMGLPVMITANISDDSALIQEHAIGSIIDPVDQHGYRKAIEQMDDLLKSASRNALANKIRRIAEQRRSFDSAKSIYRTIYGGWRNDPNAAN